MAQADKEADDSIAVIHNLHSDNELLHYRA